MYDFRKAFEEMDQIDRELNIENWTKVTFYMYVPGKMRMILYTYDLPKGMLSRWLWVIAWRRAKLICKYPRGGVTNDYLYYDKNTGLETGTGSLLGRLSKLKLQIKKSEDKIRDYIAYSSANNMFFYPDTDEDLLKARRILENKKKEFAMLQQQVYELAQEKRNNY